MFYIVEDCFMVKNGIYKMNGSVLVNGEFLTFEITINGLQDEYSFAVEQAVRKYVKRKYKVDL